MPKKTPKKKLTGAAKNAETIRKRHEFQKQKLLELLEEAPNLGAALARVGINRSTFGRWRDDDPNFSIEVRHAMERAIEHTADNVELALLSSAREGKVSAQRYYLDHNHPRYMPRREEESEEDVLTEERKEQIYQAVKAWSSYDDGDERDEDYEVSDDDDTKKSSEIEYDDEGNMIR